MNDRIAAEVNRFSKVSTLNAAEWYEEMRDEAGIKNRFSVSLLEPPPDEQIFKSLNWATRTIDSDPATTRNKVEGAAQKLVTDVGRDTIVTAVGDDREASAYARYARPGACYFCALMATRGAVYHSEESAGIDANDRFEGEGEAKFHDHCHCTLVPVFKGQRYEPPGHIERFDQIYRESTGDYSGKDKLRAFRRALESDPSGTG